MIHPLPVVDDPDRQRDLRTSIATQTSELLELTHTPRRPLPGSVIKTGRFGRKVFAIELPGCESDDIVIAVWSGDLYSRRPGGEKFDNVSLATASEEQLEAIFTGITLLVVRLS